MYLYNELKQQKAFEDFKKHLTQELTDHDPDSPDSLAVAAELDMLNDDINCNTEAIQRLLQ